MGKIYMLIAAVIIIQNYGVRLNAQECPTSLVHYWKLDKNSEGFEDIVGGLTGQVESASITVLGIVDSAQYFNGLSEISVPDDITFDWDEDDSFSIEFWLRKTSNCLGTSSSSNNVVIGRDDPSSGLHWWIGIDCQNSGNINFTLLSNDGNGTNMNTHTGIIDGNWHHIIAVHDGDQNTTSLYVDSELDTIAAFDYLVGFGSLVPVNIGWLNRGLKYHLDASVDELAIYNVALSQETISDHYNNGNGKAYCTDIGTGMGNLDPEDIFSVYPSVATSEVHVSFNLQNEQRVKLTAFDLTGKKISELLNKNFSKGPHNFVFSTGLFAKNSLVLFQLELNDNVLTRKIVVQ